MDGNKFEVLVQIGKRFCKNQDFKLCNAVLKTALMSHCSLMKASYWLQSDTRSLDQSVKEDTVIETSTGHGFSSIYLATGFHSDTTYQGNLEDAHVQATSVVDSNTLMSALITLCLSYFSLSEFKQALIYCKTCLQLALEIGSKKYELKSYVHLANIYQKQGDYLQAISYNGKLLAVGRDLVKSSTPACHYERFWNINEECKALWNLSQAYKSLSDIQTARRYASEYLEVLKTVDEAHLSTPYSNLGELELLMGNLNAALEHNKMALRYTKKFNEKVTMAYAYGEIGNVYAAMGNKSLSEINHAQHMKLAQSIGDSLSELTAMKQLGDMYRYGVHVGLMMVMMFDVNDSNDK